MPIVYFYGGPCDHTHRTFTDEAVKDGKVTCGGVTYYTAAISGGNFDAFPHRIFTPAPVAVPISRTARSWRRVVHQLVTEAPKDLRRANAAAQHLARIGRRS